MVTEIYVELHVSILVALNQHDLETVARQEGHVLPWFYTVSM